MILLKWMWSFKIFKLVNYFPIINKLILLLIYSQFIYANVVPQEFLNNKQFKI